MLKRMSESQLGGRHATVGQCVCMTRGITLLPNVMGSNPTGGSSLFTKITALYCVVLCCVALFSDVSMVLNVMYSIMCTCTCICVYIHGGARQVHGPREVYMYIVHDNQQY